LPDRDAIVDILNDAVRAAGALALEFYGAAPKSWLKDNDTPVSEADLAVNELLQDRLCAARPDYGWMSEETHDTSDRLTRERVWVVDPIDGTRAFLHNKPHWTISVALVEAGRPIVSAVFNPVENEFFEARTGQTSLLNGTPISASKRETLAGSKMLAHGHVFKRETWPKPWPAFEIEMRNSMAYRICLVAQGRFDVALALSAKSDWDLAAADLIVTQAGGSLTSAGGNILHYNQKISRHKPVLAAGPHLHKEMLEYLR
jgi:myo-inositol-1(or 4)-monophosphatase